MKSECNKPLIQFEIMAIIAVCGLLFIAAFREVGHPLWSIPAMTPVLSHRDHSPLHTICKYLACGF